MNELWVGVSVLVGGLVGYVGGYKVGFSFAGKAMREWMLAADKVTDGGYTEQVKQINQKLRKLLEANNVR